MDIIKGDLIELAKEGRFSVIGHGCNCFCSMDKGIAIPFAKEFQCDKYPMESEQYYGDINKLGSIEVLYNDKYKLYVANMYTQYLRSSMMESTEAKGIPVSYLAVRQCLIKLGESKYGQNIGLPLIACGRGGGNWNQVKGDIETILSHCKVTIVILE